MKALKGRHYGLFYNTTPSGFYLILLMKFSCTEKKPKTTF